MAATAASASVLLPRSCWGLWGAAAAGHDNIQPLAVRSACPDAVHKGSNEYAGAQQLAEDLLV